MIVPIGEVGRFTQISSNRIREKRDQFRPRALAGNRKAGHRFRRMKPRIVPQPLACVQSPRNPIAGRVHDQVNMFEYRTIHLHSNLLRIPTIDEYGRAIFENNCKSRRSRETCEPQQSLGVRRHILVLVLIRPRNNESVDPGCGDPLAKLRYPNSSPCWAAQFGERLKPCVKHLTRSSL